MKFEIDFSKVSHDDIRRLIRMLEAYLGEHLNHVNQMLPESSGSNVSVPDSTGGFFNLFDVNASKPSTIQQEEVKESVSDIPRVIPY